jgi:ABC-2 type transport system permease protein
MTQIVVAPAHALEPMVSPRTLPVLGAFTARDFRVARSYKISFITNIASMAISMVTFRFISRLVGDAPALHGIGNYFGFVVVGLAMAQVLEASIAAPANAVRAEQMQGTLEVLATTPLRPSALAFGWLGYPIANALATAMIMLGLATPLGLRFGPHPNALLAAVAFACSAVAFAGLGILGAAVVLVIQQAANVTKWIATGMAFVSGVFFPLTLFPRWVAVVSQASPLTHSLRVVRGSLLGGASAGSLFPDLLALLAFAAIVVPLSIGVMSLALRRARRTGAIATY